MGFGLDCVAMARMEKSLRRPHFVQRVFSPAEAELFQNKGGQAAASAAACFAAKEAFLKACGKGLSGFALCDVAALRKDSGAPYLCLSGAAKAFCEVNHLRCHLSVSHEAGLAFAYVVLEQGPL